MNIISIQHFDGKYPSFNVALSSKEGAEPFLTIRGCRIVNGSKGAFVSFPAQKKEDGSYWNHVISSERFQCAILEAHSKSIPASQSAPAARPRGNSYAEAKSGRAPSFAEMDDDLPPF